MSIAYAWEKFHLAIHSLAAKGSQKERLINAISYSLIHLEPANDLPKEMREEFEMFISEMTYKPAVADEGKIQATVNSLDELGIDRAIEKIISFYDAICRADKA